jgi:hypothetical protein
LRVEIELNPRLGPVALVNVRALVIIDAVNPGANGDHLNAHVVRELESFLLDRQRFLGRIRAWRTAGDRERGKRAKARRVSDSERVLIHRIHGKPPGKWILTLSPNIGKKAHPWVSGTLDSKERADAVPDSQRLDCPILATKMRVGRSQAPSRCTCTDVRLTVCDCVALRRHARSSARGRLRRVAIGEWAVASMGWTGGCRDLLAQPVRV